MLYVYWYVDKGRDKGRVKGESIGCGMKKRVWKEDCE